MPLPVAHALLGATVVEAGFPVDRKEKTRLYLIGAGVAVLPDFDLFFSWILGFGNRWHGGVTHSIVFAVILGLLGARLSGMWNRRAVIVFSCAALSHGILDTITRRRFSGSALLWPFSRYKFKLGWFDYFAFYPASRLEPLPSLIRRALVISAYELLIFGMLFVAVFLTHRLIAWRSRRRRARIEGSGKTGDQCAAAD
jgi:membrane-bound metal-dependent hydrolase YbcI (DUF457 family)